MSTVAAEGAEANPEIAETVEEIRFYLEHFMTDQARTGLEKLETLTHDAALLDSLRAAIEAAAKSSEEPEVEIAEVDIPDGAIPEADVPEAFFRRPLFRRSVPPILRHSRLG